MINHSHYRLRKASVEDIDITFQWQIHPLVRRHSRNSSPPDSSDHDAWFRKSLENQSRELWMFERKAKPLGQLRLDRGDKNEVSILISPEFLGKGYGDIALKLLCNQYGDIDLWAYVKIENVASINLFTKNHFRHQQGNWYLLRSTKR